ncbi:TonB-dependent receptor [Edwardsiella piscicida]|nr:TonB-dependent receptor [Edwardsiella piscicida]
MPTRKEPARPAGDPNRQRRPARRRAGLELRVRRALHPWPALSLQADYYRIDYTDSKIIYDNASASFVNLGRARYQGIEMEAFYSPPSWRG